MLECLKIVQFFGQTGREINNIYEERVVFF